MSSTRYKVCSKCGAHLVRRENVMTTSQPSLYIYDCPECGNVEYDINMYPRAESACGLVYSEIVDYKAKYEEALEKARVIYKGRKAMHYTDEVSDLESLFPELTEANDEMMIEAIIEALDSHCNSINHLSACGYQMEDVEAWLEKKKDSIPYEKYVEDIAVINAEAKTKYHAGWNDGYEAKQKEQKPKEWNEKPCLTCDEYDKGYKQGYTEGCTAGYNKAMLEQPKQEWSEEEAKKAAEDYADEYPGMMHENDGSTIEDYDKPYNDFMAGVLWAKNQGIFQNGNTHKKSSEEKKKETLDGADIGYGLETAIDILENGFTHYQTDDGEYERKQALAVLIFLLNETRKKEDAKQL